MLIDDSLPDDCPPRVWTVFSAVLLALLLAVLFQAVLGCALVILLLTGGTDREQLPTALMDRILSPLGFIMMAGCGQLGFAIAGFVPALRSSEPFRERVALQVAKPSWRVYPVAMLGSIFVLAIGLAAAYAVSTVVPPDESLEKVFDKMTIPMAIVFVLFIGLAPGIIEEVLFRGYIQQRLVKRWGVAKGITITSILFALVHVTPHAIAAVVPIGFWLGYIAWRSGSILPAMLCHFFVNAGLNAWRLIVKFAEISEPTQIAVSIIAVLVGAACFIACLMPWFWREPPSDRSFTE